ncbi:hypothetical protein TcasGA2_TC008374 [Tribolium castaneum]|uniref:Uncharacterized protein n=1 Tax=Tribolium castaneum TaxID=7070 RepID=D2A1D2_TRICA|nr:hypothetical protein TcasGA2_TC008374 [Tribolium castaneum]
MFILYCSASYIYGNLAGTIESPPPMDKFEHDKGVTINLHKPKLKNRQRESIKTDFLIIELYRTENIIIVEKIHYMPFRLSLLLPKRLEKRQHELWKNYGGIITNIKIKLSTPRCALFSPKFVTYRHWSIHKQEKKSVKLFPTLKNSFLKAAQCFSVDKFITSTNKFSCGTYAYRGVENRDDLYRRKAGLLKSPLRI